MRRLRGSKAMLITAAAATLVLTASAANAILPYNPTSVFLAPNGTDVVYVFEGGELVVVDISKGLRAEDLREATSVALPFLDGDDEERVDVAYTPAISPSGAIAVSAGTCSSTTTSLWIYEPSRTEDGEGEGSQEGRWTQVSSTESEALAASHSPHNANFLGSSIYFSTLVDTEDKNRSIYNFGGMCPLSNSRNESEWQSGAIYSNTMLKLSPTDESAEEYEIEMAAVTGLKPVPEAGFSMTGLIPAYSNASSDVTTQAQTFVLIGGHTESAFIGMGQVALFSLPQESWTFQQVSAEPEEGNQAPTVPPPDSRSGHTAVLSSDGSRIIVFGGWVGDVNTAAEPQLAVLKLGSGFGGEGEWMWETPKMDETSLGLDEGEGIYGHGAVMLPGNVMMIAGGFRISESSLSAKRAEGSFKAMFLNTTSMSWIDEYTNPSYSAAAPNPEAPEKPMSAADNSRRVAIGTGVGVGVAAIIGAIVLYFWYQRKLNRKRNETRDRDLAALSQTAHRDMPYYGPDGEMQQRIGAGAFGGRSISSYGFGDAQNQPAYGPIEYTGYDHEENRDMDYTVTASSLSRSQFTIPRKPPNTRNARGYYQPTPVATQNTYEFGASHSRANSLGTAGAIHPIYEADEDDHGDIAVIGALHHDLPSATDERADPFSDPSPSVQRTNNQLHMQAFVEPISPIRSPSSAAREKDREIKEWVSDWAAADAYLARSSSVIHHPPSMDRLSPGTGSGMGKDTNSNSGRTGSNLSEATQSEFSLSRNDSTSTRTKSLTAFFTGGAQNAFSLFGSMSGVRRGDANAARRSELVHGQYAGPGSGRATAEGYYTSGSLSPDGSDRGTVIASGPGPGRPPRSAGSGSASVSSHSGNSFNTAHSHSQAHSTSFPALREQGAELLPRPGQRVWDEEPGSPSKHKPLRNRSALGLNPSGGWLGSIKKALGREEWVPSPGVGEEHSPFSLSDYRDSPSPTRQTFGEGAYRDLGGYDAVGAVMPQRTVSASAQLWRRKQGRGGWEDDDGSPSHTNQRSFTTSYPLYDPTSISPEREDVDEEWDVEKAVMGRQVQIIGTVKRERLRVVNHDVRSDDESDLGISLSSNRPPVPQQDILTGSPMRDRSPERPSTPERAQGGEEFEMEMQTPTQSQDQSQERKGKGKAVLGEPISIVREGSLRHIPPPRDTPSPTLSSRSLSPSKSVRSIKSGRVSQLVQQMEKRDGAV